MSDRNFFDVGFDLLESITKWLHRRGLITVWFNFLSWASVTALMFYVASKTTVLFYPVPILSVIFLFFYAWHVFFDEITDYISQNRPYQYSRLVALLVIGGVFPLATIFVIFQAITTIFSNHS